jgi:PIN domain nuclease of toxin-antitoxin system
MMLLDASAVLGLLQAEPGWEMVEAEIASGHAILNVVNQAEVLSKLCEWGMDLPDAQLALAKLALPCEPFTPDMALEAARLRPLTRALGLSLGDRACLATARCLQCPVLTGDRPWLTLMLPLGLDIRCFRPDTH